MNSPEGNGALPDGWAAAVLGQIADCRLGKMLDAAKNRGEPRPYLRNVNVQWGRIDVDDIKELRITADEQAQYAVLPGDLLVCEGGEPGRCAVWNDGRQMYLQKALHRVRPRGGTSPEYLRWWFQHAANTGRLASFFTGSTIKHLPGRQLARVYVALPPVVEQRRIAALLDEAEERRAATAAHLEAANTAVERFRSAVVAAACSGQLTDDWRESHHPQEGSQSLARRIADDRRLALGTRYREPPLIEVQWDIPKSWVWTTPEHLSRPERALTYGVIKLGRPTPDGVPTLRSSDVRWLRIDAQDVKRISSAIADNFKRTYLEGGEILVTVRGTLGGVAVVPPSMAGWNVSREVAVIPLVAATHAPFVALAIGSPQCQRWLTTVAKGVAYTGVNIEDLKRLPLPLPPYQEQVEIARRAYEMLSAAGRLTAQIDGTSAALDRISRASRAKAFRGQLVPTEAALAAAEGRDFESGGQLLARIGAMQPTPSPRRRRGASS